MPYPASARTSVSTSSPAGTSRRTFSRFSTHSATQALAAAITNDSPAVPNRSADWHSTRAGDCVYPRYSHGRPCHGHVPRNHSAAATHTAAVSTTRTVGDASGDRTTFAWSTVSPPPSPTSRAPYAIAPAYPQYRPRIVIRPIMPGTVTADIHHMLAMKNSVPATQLQPNAAQMLRHRLSTTSHGTSPTHAR